jgi:hypothetical protein
MEAINTVCHDLEYNGLDSLWPKLSTLLVMLQIDYIVIGC